MAGHVDRTVLSSYYQNPGQDYDDTMTEGALETLAAAIDSNYDLLAETAANGAVTTAKIADGAVTAAKVANGSLTAAKFVPGALTNDTQNGLRITEHLTDPQAHKLTSGNHTWYQNGGQLFHSVSMDKSQPDLDAAVLYGLYSGTGGVHGGVPNVGGSQKAVVAVNASRYDNGEVSLPGYTGVGTLMGFYSRVDSAGTDYNPANAATTYREVLPFLGSVTAFNGGLVEGMELQVYSEGTAPTDMIGEFISMSKNNPDTTGRSTGLFISSIGVYAPKKAIEINGAWNNGIDLQSGAFSEYPIRLPAGKGINFGGAAKTTNIVSTPTGDEFQFFCDNQLVMTLNKFIMMMHNSVVIQQNAGVPGATFGQGYAAKGSLCIDTTNGDFYINAGTSSTPSWKKVTRAV